MNIVVAVTLAVVWFAVFWAFWPRRKRWPRQHVEHGPSFWQSQQRK